MPKHRTGISQMGGKSRSTNTLLKYTPYHEFFQSLFCGACWFEINKPRCRYENFNDLDSEIINYLLMTRQYPKEFDEMKQGVMGLVSQEICNRIVRGEMKPRNNLERGYFFYYLNKLTFGGDVKKIGGTKETKEEHAHYGSIMRLTDPCRQPQVEKIKKEYKTKGYRGMIDCGSKNVYGCIPRKDELDDIKKEYQTKGFAGIINTRAIPQHTLHDEDSDKIIEEWKTKGYIGLIDNQTMSKSGYGRVDAKEVEKAKRDYEFKTKGFFGVVKQDIMPSTSKQNVEKAKAAYRGIVPKPSFKGIAIHGATSWGALEKGEVEKSKKQYQAVSYKGLSPKTTRSYTNNDCGLLTPLDPKCIKRLRYVNLTCYDFRKGYKLFYKVFHERKGLSRECFIFSDPPYPGTEKYFGDKFKPEDHQDLIDLMLETPFNFMLSIGGKCDFYLEQLKDWNIVPVEVRYSTDARSQKKSQEYIIMNYDIVKVAKMTQDFQSIITNFFSGNNGC